MKLTITCRDGHELVAVKAETQGTMLASPRFVNGRVVAAYDASTFEADVTASLRTDAYGNATWVCEAGDTIYHNAIETKATLEDEGERHIITPADERTNRWTCSCGAAGCDVVDLAAHLSG